MNALKKLLVGTALAAVLTLSPSVAPPAAAAPASPAAGATAAPKTSTSTAPTAAQIADAKAKGMVWVNLNTKVYHKDGKYYGTTKNGKFMTEADAQKAGYKLAKTPGGAKASASPKS